MAADSHRAVRGVADIRVALICAATAALAILVPAEPSRQGGLRGAVDPTDPGLRRHVADPLATAPDSAPTRIVLGPLGRDVRLSGELTEGASERLRRLLDAHAAVERIHLTSEGGLVEEGAAIGDLIAARGLVTYVPDYCVSACTLAFVRGRERLVIAQARLGFHAPYETGPFGLPVAADSAPERAAYLAAGLKPDFVDAALRVPPEDLMIPDARTLVAAGVATGIVDDDRFPDSTLDDGAGLDQARAVILRDVPVLGAIEAGAPGTVDAIAAWYLDGYRQGLSEGATFGGIHRLAAEAIGRSLAGAEPRVLVDLGGWVLRALRHQGSERSTLCDAAERGIGAVLARPGLGRGELTAIRGLVARALTLRSEGTPSEREAPAPTLAAETAPSRARRGRGCGALRDAFAAALARPMPQAALALRPLLFPASSIPALEASARPR